MYGEARSGVLACGCKARAFWHGQLALFPFLAFQLWGFATSLYLHVQVIRELRDTNSELMHVSYEM